MTSGGKKYLFALLALLATQAAANVFVLRAHPDLINNVPHDLLMDGLERLRGEAVVYPEEIPPTGIFFDVPAWLLPRTGILSELGFKLSTSLYWLGALVFAFLAGMAAKDARAGFWTALALSGFVFANNFSRGFDVHVPRMMWLLASAAPLIAWTHFGGVVYPLLAIPPLYLGMRYVVTPSDGPLFVIGVAGPLAAAVIARWWKLRERSRRMFIGVGIVIVFIAWKMAQRLWSIPSFNADHLREEAARGEFLPGGWVDIPRHLFAYPIYLAFCAVGWPMLILTLPALFAACRSRESVRRYFLPGLLIPVIVLTLIPKKNPHYINVVLPFLALGVGLGIAELSRKRIAVAAAALLIVIGANAATWTGERTDLPMTAFEPAFQFVGPFHYLASPLDYMTLARRNRMTQIVRKSCEVDRPCRIASFGVLPDETQILLPASYAYPRLKFVRILQDRGPQTGWDFEALCVNTASFHSDFRTTFMNVDMSDLNAVAEEISKRVESLHREGVYVNDVKAIIAPMIGRFEHAGRFEGLDYYRRTLAN